LHFHGKKVFELEFPAERIGLGFGEENGELFVFGAAEKKGA
jgi:hypothetical protein